jgi:outer membrane biosynthesis protein TonB
MFDEMKKLLSEGITIPATVVVGFKFNTPADEEIFKNLVHISSLGQVAPEESAEPTEAEKPEVKPVAEPKAEPKVEPKAKIEPVTKVEPKVEAPVEKQIEPKTRIPSAHYSPVPGDADLRYREDGNELVVKRKKMHFFTSWSEIDNLSRMSDEEYNRPHILSELGKIYKAYVHQFVQYYKKGVVKPSVTQQTTLTPKVVEEPVEKPAEKTVTKTTKKSVLAPIEKPIERSVRKSTEDHSFDLVRGEKNLKYKTTGDILVIKSDDSIINTTWDEIARLADLSSIRLSRKVENLFKNDIIRQKALSSFVRAYQFEKVRDPDAGFKSMLNINTKAKYGGYGGHVRGTLEDLNVPED